MPGDFKLDQKSIREIREALGQYLKTSELFGEDEVSYSPAPEPAPVEGKDLEKSARLQALYQKYSNCQNCPLGKTRDKIVFGMGSLSPKVLFIGEGPGYEEDRRGLPFVGRAGELLDKILSSIGLSRETVYIANIVKCHPMKNPLRNDLRGNDRPPEPSEIDACRPILEEQIEILDPPVICALGSTSAKALLNTREGITRLRGKLVDFKFPKSGKVVPLLPTYHPAALLRDPGLKREVWEDMKSLKSLIKW